MRHWASSAFWDARSALPLHVQRQADAAFELLKRNPSHPGLRLKKVEQYWSARIGLHYRALATEVEGELLWFWIGSHADYDRLIR